MYNWRIMGWWWYKRFGIVGNGLLAQDDKAFPGIFTAPCTFVGDVEIDSEGNFAGTMVDEVGRSSVVGKIFGESLRFEKRYDSPTKRGSSSSTIFYDLLAAEVPTETYNGILPGGRSAGWKGEYIIEDGVPPTKGEAACMLFPLR